MRTTADMERDAAMLYDGTPLGLLARDALLSITRNQANPRDIRLAAVRLRTDRVLNDTPDERIERVLFTDDDQLQFPGE